MSNLVAIVGRPNVGKSTFFNRLLGERKAIVDNISGVTRDRQYGVSNWNGKDFMVVDTGGFVYGSEDIFEAAIRRQVHLAIDEAKVIIFLTDAQAGVTDLDNEVARLLRQTKKPVFLVVNKVDNHNLLLDANEFWSLGFDNLHPIAAMSGSGTGDLLDAVVEHLDVEAPDDSGLPKVAVLGQPNAGKSTLINALLGEDRNIVTDIAGTTRDSINSRYTKFGHDFMLIDTAGIRRKTRVKEDLEFYSVMRALKALDDADIILLTIDATMGLEAQDLAIFRLAQRRNKGIILVFNKWDLVEKDTMTAKKFVDQVNERIAPFTDLPILFISALEKQRIHKAVDTVMEVYENRTRQISTSKLNDVILEAVETTPPPTYRGHFIKIKYVTQITAKYPAFVFFCNQPKEVPENYRNFLEKKLRETFNFTGTPIALYFREK